VVRKPSNLKKGTDMKVDGAYADIVAPPRAEGDPFRQTADIQGQIDAVGGPLAQEVAATGGMPNVNNLSAPMGDDLFTAPTQNVGEPGNQISDMPQLLDPNANRVDTLRSIILENYPHRAIKNRLL
jgi:hypothetical protein